MKRLLATCAALLIASTACSNGEAPRRVFLDFSHDEFASYFLRMFPQEISVHPGSELVFDQTWTGEPHSVTGGTLVNTLMEAARPFRTRFYEGEPIPDDPPKEIMKLEEELVWSYGEDDELNQTAAQPCYLTSGKPRQDGEPCSEQDQPTFTGRQSYYNSGIVPYEGPSGNEYRVKLADDIEPGSYWFYCNVHGEFQSTEVVVKPQGQKVDTPQDVARRAREELDRLAAPLLKLYSGASSAGRVAIRTPGAKTDVTIRGNFAGIANPVVWDAAVNEFVPKTIRARRGEKITWNVMGGHTISFGVPAYFPIITFNEDGSVERNPKLDPPAGGARKFPEDDEVTSFDGGSYDGEGFWSSGMVFGEGALTYTMRITKPGRYKYACLVHPPMVGTVEVT